MAPKWLRGLRSLTSKRFADESKDDGHVGVDATQTENEVQKESQSVATTKANTTEKDVAADDANNSDNNVPIKIENGVSSQPDKKEILDKAESTKRKARKKSGRDGRSIPEKAKKEPSNDSAEDQRHDERLTNSAKTKTKKKKKRKTSRDRGDINVTSSVDDSCDPGDDDTVHPNYEQSMKKRKSKRKRKAKRTEDQKDLLIRNLRKEVEQQEISIKTLNETVESLQRKLELMERGILVNNDSAKAGVKEDEKNTTIDEKRRPVDDDHVQSSKESDQNVQDRAYASSVFASSDSQLSLLSEVTPTSTEVDASSMDMGDVFERLIPQDSSEEDASLNDTKPVVAGLAAETGRSINEEPKTERQRQRQRSQRHQNHNSCLEFENLWKYEQYVDNKSYKRKLWASAPNLSYDWTRNKVQDDLAASDVEEVLLEKYESDEEISDDECHQNDDSKCKMKDAIDDNVSLDDDELFDLSEKAPLPRKPLLTAALKAKSMSNLNITCAMDDNVSLNDDELFDLPEKAPLPKKPLLTAALKAKSMSNLNITCANDDSVSLNDDELFDLPEKAPLPKKPLLTAALKAKSMSNLNITCANDDSVSLNDDELFDLPEKPPLQKKPLLTAALKAKSMSNLNSGCEDSDDDGAISLSDNELFDIPKVEPHPKKPLLAAALKAKSISDFNSAESLSESQRITANNE